MYYNRDGRELVRGFDFENRWATVYESVLTGEPSTFSIETLEPTRTIAFSGDTLRALYNRHPCWDRFGRRIVEAQWIRQSDFTVRVVSGVRLSFERDSSGAVTGFDAVIGSQRFHGVKRK